MATINLATLLVDVKTAGVAKAQASLASVNKVALSLAQSFGRVSAAILSFGVVIGTFRVLRNTIKLISDFESSLVAVGKTSGLAGESLQRFGKNIRALALEIPVATTELLSIAEAAGQLGITGEQNLVVFTRAIANLSSAASSLGGNPADSALKLARILTLTGEQATDITTLTNVIVRLGNDVAATEAEIVDLATRIAQSTVAFRLSSAEVTALSAASKTLGLNTEATGTAIGRAFRQINNTIRTGSVEAQDVLERLTNKSIETFGEEFAADNLDGFTQFLRGVAREGLNASEALKKIGLGNSRDLRVIDTLGKGYQQVAVALELTADELIVNNAAAVEAAQAFDTLAGRTALLGNIVDEVGLLLGTTLLPVMSEFVEVTASIISGIFGIESNVEELNPVLSGLGKTIKAVVVGFVAFKAAAFASTVITGLLSLVGTVDALAASFAALRIAIAGLGFAIGPALAIGGLAAASTFITKAQSDAEFLVSTFRSSKFEAADLSKQIRKLTEAQEQLNKATEAGDDDAILAARERRVALLQVAIETLKDQVGEGSAGFSVEQLGALAGPGTEAARRAGTLASYIQEINDSFKDNAVSSNAKKILEFANSVEVFYAATTTTPQRSAELSVLLADIRALGAQAKDGDLLGALVTRGGIESEANSFGIVPILKDVDQAVLSTAESSKDLFGKIVKLFDLRADDATIITTIAQLEEQLEAAGVSVADLLEKLQFGTKQEQDRNAATGLNLFNIDRLEEEQALLDQLAPTRERYNRSLEISAELSTRAVQGQQARIDAAVLQLQGLLATVVGDQELARNLAEDQRGGITEQTQRLDDLTEELRDYADAQREANTFLFENQLAAVGFASGLDNISSALGEAVVSGEDFGEAFSNAIKRVIADLITMAARIFLVRTLLGPILGSAFNLSDATISQLTGVTFSSENALGNIFNRGRVTPFERGGVFNSPTTFPMSGGGTGLLGEAGPEAIMPLVRLPGSSRLGVESAGGGGAVVYNATFNFGNNVSPDAAFRYSARQFETDLRDSSKRVN